MKERSSSRLEKFEVQQKLIVVVLCVAANVALGKLSNVMALPFTMDTIGTIVGATILPLPLAIAVGVTSSLAASVVINPVFIYFTGTQIVIALVAFFLAKKNLFSSIGLSLFAGLLIGVASAIVSAPVIALVFGGVSVPSISAVNALLLASGKGLWESVIAGSLIVESIDKIFAGFVSYLIIRRLLVR